MTDAGNTTSGDGLRAFGNTSVKGTDDTWHQQTGDSEWQPIDATTLLASGPAVSEKPRNHRNAAPTPAPAPAPDPGPDAP